MLTSFLINLFTPGKYCDKLKVDHKQGANHEIFAKQAV